jgi:hypothetical protein
VTKRGAVLGKSVTKRGAVLGKSLAKRGKREKIPYFPKNSP